MNQFSYLLRQTWFRIGVALWLGLLAAGIVGVLRWSILANLLAGVGGEGLAAAVGRSTLVLVAGSVSFAVAWVALQTAYRSSARPPYENNEADDLRVESPVASEPIESWEEPEDIEAEVASKPVEVRTDEAIELSDASVEPPNVPPADHSDLASQPFTFGEDDGIELRLDSIPAKLGPMRQAWLRETGETLGTPQPLTELEEDIAYGIAANEEAGWPTERGRVEGESGDDPESVKSTLSGHDGSEQPRDEADNLNPERFVPSLTELEKRLANAITRLDQVSPDRGNEERADEEFDDAPLLDEEARKAVERALAKLENYTHRK